MHKRLFLDAILLSVLLFSAIAGTQFVYLTRANGILEPPPISQIYIRADGSVEPSTAPIQQVGNVYTFTSNSFNSTIEVQRDNIVIDGAGFTLQGHGSNWYKGIMLSNRTNVTIKNIVIRDFGVGISTLNSSNIIIAGNKIIYSAKCVELTSFSSNQNLTDENGNLIDPTSRIEILSYYNQIVGNSMKSADSGYGYGVYSFGSSNNTIAGNDFSDFGQCIHLQSGSYNIILENQFNASKTGIHLDKEDNNIIYRNNFLDNDQNAITSVVVGVNFWDNGKEGNFWSDYTGKDANGDGIGDYRYTIPPIGSNFDNYPLQSPVNVSIPSLNPSKHISYLPTPSPTSSPILSASPNNTPSLSPTPSPSIPEFPSWIILSVIAIATLFVVKTVRSKKGTKILFLWENHSVL